MFIERVSLNHFRNIEQLDLELSRGVNILRGLNAQGKTNFLEAVYYGSAGRSHRTNYDRDLVAFHEADAHIRIIVNRRGVPRRIDAHIRREGSRGFALDGMPVRRLGELLGELLTVIFSPEDLNLVKAGPAERRRFMDMEICQLSPVYYYELRQYHKALRQRNALLKELRGNPSLRGTLFMWTEQMAEHGTRVYGFRRDFVERLSAAARDIHSRVTGGVERLDITYRPNTTPGDFIDRLSRNIDRDIYLGATSCGVHKDDIAFHINETDARSFASQGQQRTAALTLKLAEIELIRQDTGETPVLLLDDVLSELDRNRQDCLIGHIEDLQAIITCAGMEEALMRLCEGRDVSVLEAKGGVIAHVSVNP